MKSCKDNIADKWSMPRNWWRTSKRQGGVWVLFHSFKKNMMCRSIQPTKRQWRRGGFQHIVFFHVIPIASRLHRRSKLLHWHQQPRPVLAPFKLRHICSCFCGGSTWCQDEGQGGEGEAKRTTSKEKAEEKMEEGRHWVIHACFCNCYLRSHWPNILEDEKQQMRELEEAWPEAGSTQSLQNLFAKHICVLASTGRYWNMKGKQQNVRLNRQPCLYQPAQWQWAMALKKMCLKAALPHRKLSLHVNQFTASEKPLPWSGVTFLYSGNGGFAICNILRHAQKFLHQSCPVLCQVRISHWYQGHVYRPLLPNCWCAHIMSSICVCMCTSTHKAHMIISNLYSTCVHLPIHTNWPNAPCTRLNSPVGIALSQCIYSFYLASIVNHLLITAVLSNTRLPRRACFGAALAHHTHIIQPSIQHKVTQEGLLWGLAFSLWPHHPTKGYPGGHIYHGGLQMGGLLTRGAGLAAALSSARRLLHYPVQPHYPVQGGCCTIQCSRTIQCMVTQEGPLTSGGCTCPAQPHYPVQMGVALSSADRGKLDYPVVMAFSSAKKTQAC